MVEKDDFYFFLIGRTEGLLNTVSAPDLTPLNTEGAALPILSVDEKKNREFH